MCTADVGTDNAFTECATVIVSDADAPLRRLVGLTVNPTTTGYVVVPLDVVAAPMATTFPDNFVLVPSATTVAASPTVTLARWATVTVDVTSYPPLLTTTTLAVLDAAETVAPAARLTVAIVPLIGLTIVA